MKIKQFPPIADKQLPRHPGPLLVEWINDARTAEVPLPTVGSLATASMPDGRVSSRMVNFQNVSSTGEVTAFSDFKTSRKAADLKSNSSVAVTFYWQMLNRSVRIEGSIAYLSLEETQEYFRSRPKDFQASVSLGGQSHPVEGGREKLAEILASLKSQPELPVPGYWMGATVRPSWIEFWQGSPDRISDRIVYKLEGSEWIIARLSP